jgi:hypothetical protein
MVVGKPRTVNRYGFDSTHAASRRSGVNLVARPRIWLLGRGSGCSADDLVARPRIWLLGRGSGCSAEDLVARPRIWLLGRGSGCSAENLFAPAGESAARAGNSSLRPADVRSRPGIAPAAGESPARRGIGWLGRRSAPSAARAAARRRSRLLGGPSARSGQGPAPSPLESFAPRVVRQLRQSASLLGRPAALVEVEVACGEIRPPASGTGMAAPALDVSARRSIRWLRSPIQGLGWCAVHLRQFSVAVSVSSVSPW